jgi:hypothetical protein
MNDSLKEWKAAMEKAMRGGEEEMKAFRELDAKLQAEGHFPARK